MSELHLNPAVSACQRCKSALPKSYYLQGQSTVICPACHEALAIPIRLKGWEAFLRALFAGGLTGILMALAGALVIVLTGRDYAIVWLGAAYVIGRAIKSGSEDRGTLPFRLMALGSVYCAIGLSWLFCLLYFAVAGVPKDDESTPANRMPFLGMLKPSELSRTAGNATPSVGSTPGESASPRATASPALTAASKSVATSRPALNPSGKRAPGAVATPVPDVSATPGTGDPEFLKSFSGGTKAAIGIVLIVLLPMLVVAVAPVLVMVASPISILLYGLALHQAWKATARECRDLSGPYSVGVNPEDVPLAGQSGPGR